jgi:hypothetical protein
MTYLTQGQGVFGNETYKVAVSGEYADTDLVPVYTNDPAVSVAAFSASMILTGRVASQNVPLTHIITRLEFRNLFTIFEKIRLDNYATDPVLTAQQKAIVCTLMQDFSASTYIDLCRPDTQSALSYLTSIGILTPDRLATIRSTIQ